MAKVGIDLGAEAAESTVALNPIVGIAREDLIGAVGAMLRETAGRPLKTFGHLKDFGGEVVKILKNDSDLAPDAKDKRFGDPVWRTNPLYKAGLQTYLALRKDMRNMIDEAGFDEIERARASFVTGMILDALAPTPVCAISSIFNT
jgi:polyhydroxyalkanoate synthase